MLSKKSENEGRGIIAETERNRNAEAVKSFGHTYYQALLLIIGKSRKYDCWAPNQDKNKLFVNESLGSLRTLPATPDYSYRHLVVRALQNEFTTADAYAITRELEKLHPDT